MSAVTQSDRLLAVHTTLDFDVLLIESFVAHEEISRPFHFDLRLVADSCALRASLPVYF